MTKVLKNAFDTERTLFKALANIAAKLNLSYKVPTSQDRAALVAARIDEAVLDWSNEVIDSGADTSVTIAANGTSSYTVPSDGFLLLNDFTGTGGQKVTVDDVEVYTVVSGQRIQLRVVADSVVAVVDTADGGTTFKRNFFAR